MEQKIECRDIRVQDPEGESVSKEAVLSPANWTLARSVQYNLVFANSYCVLFLNFNSHQQKPQDSFKKLQFKLLNTFFPFPWHSRCLERLFPIEGCYSKILFPFEKLVNVVTNIILNSEVHIKLFFEPWE